MKIATEKWNSESRMRENRLSGLMRGGSLAVIGCKSSHSVGSCLLYTIMEPGSKILKVDEVGRVWMPPEKCEVLLAEWCRRLLR